MYLPRDVRCEIYSKITDPEEIFRLVVLYNISRNMYKETKDLTEAKNCLELKLALGCIKRINYPNLRYHVSINNNYDLLPSLEYTEPYPLHFGVDWIKKYKGRPLKNISTHIYIKVDDPKSLGSQIFSLYEKFRDTFLQLESLRIAVIDVPLPAVYGIETGSNYIKFKDIRVLDEFIQILKPRKVILQWQFAKPSRQKFAGIKFESVTELSLYSPTFFDLDYLLRTFPNVKKLSIKSSKIFLDFINYGIEEITLDLAYDQYKNLNFLNNLKGLKTINATHPELLLMGDIKIKNI